MTKKSKTVGSLVYCGPNIKGLAMTWIIYTNGLPEKLQAAADADKALAGLIVPLDQMPEAMKQIRMKYGRIYTYYKHVLDAQKG